MELTTQEIDAVLEMVEAMFRTEGGREFVRDVYSRGGCPLWWRMIDSLPSSSLFEGCEFPSGASKGVIVCCDWDFVVKIPFVSVLGNGRRSLDYCAVEVANYKAAYEEDIENMFAWTERIGRVMGIPIYVQEKLDCDEAEISSRCWTKAYNAWVDQGCPLDWLGFESQDDIPEEYDYTSENGRKELFNNYADCSSGEWDAVRPLFKEVWSSTLLGRMDCFLDRRLINDIHAGNLGMRGDYPVICDFSGYSYNIERYAKRREFWRYY